MSKALVWPNLPPSDCRTVAYSRLFHNKGDGTFEDVTTEAVARMAAYVRSSDALLAKQSAEDFMLGKAVFGALDEK